MSAFGNFGGATGNTGLFGATNTNQTTTQAQPSLFGNTNTANNTGGGLFNTNTNTNTAGGNTGGSLFGAASNQPTASTGGGLFGAQPAAATGASLFSTNTNTTGTNTNTGGLFGNNNNATTGSNIFGGNAGQTTQTNSLFGGGGTTNTNTTQPTGGGLFGANNTNTNTNTTGGLFGGGSTTNTGGGGLFGGSNTTTNTGGLFGGGASTNTGGGGLFGANTNSNTTNGQPAATTGGGLFGNTQGGNSLFGAKPANGSGLFGSTTTNTNTNTNPLLGGSLFGQPQQQQQGQQQQQQQPSLFGSTSVNPLFGQNQSTFGAAPQSNTGLAASALGAPNNLLASRSTMGALQNSSDPQAQFIKTAQSMERVYNAWNPQSKDCRFQTHFYNIVDPSKVNMYVRPPNATNDALWEKAVRENPDPSCLVPVIAIGFDDLRERIDAQTTQSTAQIQKLAELQSKLAALRTQHVVTNASRLLRAATVQTQLAQRVMRLVQHLHLLIPSIRSSALRPEEEKLRGMLEDLEEEMRRGRVKSRLNELWALIGALGASAERSNGGAGGGSGGSGGAGEWAVVDEEGLARIAQILSEQQAGLQHLTRILQKDQKDLNRIYGSSNGQDVGGEDLGMPLDSADNLWGSTSTLRASALR